MFSLLRKFLFKSFFSKVSFTGRFYNLQNIFWFFSPFLQFTERSQGFSIRSYSLQNVFEGFQTVLKFYWPFLKAGDLCLSLQTAQITRLLFIYMVPVIPGHIPPVFLPVIC